VQGGIGQLNNLNFLIDTGAVPSVISEKVAVQIGVSGPAGSLALLDQEIEAQYVTMADVHFGAIRTAHLPAVVMDLAQFEHLLGLRIDAIIGLGVLEGQSLRIDYRHRKIIPGRSDRALHVIPAEIHTASGASYWVVPISMGGHTFRMLLDTGANGLVLFSRQTRESVLGPSRKPTTLSATGEAALALEPLPVVIGDKTFHTKSVVVMRKPDGALHDIDGVLGPAALGMSLIELDWEHGCLRWQTE
jgi:predicted aspartyl protease